MQGLKRGNQAPGIVAGGGISGLEAGPVGLRPRNAWAMPTIAGDGPVPFVAVGTSQTASCAAILLSARACHLRDLLMGASRGLWAAPVAHS